ncbi:MAG: hypothetical protein OK439_07515 [Thaumarchaeota archaeon]|nr:hypothetical protein [Nitrososphaerota archaeon]
MPFEIACANCAAILYTGFDLRSPKDVIRSNDYKCKSCGKILSVGDFSVDVMKI